MSDDERLTACQKCRKHPARWLVRCPGWVKVMCGLCARQYRAEERRDGGDYWWHGPLGFPVVTEWKDGDPTPAWEHGCREAKP